MNDLEQEQDFFLSQTAELDLFAKVGSEAYRRTVRYQVRALELLRDGFEGEHSGWLIVADRAAGGCATPGELAHARAHVKEYRRSRLGLANLGPDTLDPQHALTTLFLLALADWPDAVPTSNITQLIDEFSMLYIEFFGRARALLDILKECFDV